MLACFDRKKTTKNHSLKTPFSGHIYAQSIGPVQLVLPVDFGYKYVQNWMIDFEYVTFTKF